MADVPEVTPRALKARIDAGERVTLFDVREPFERELAAIEVPPGSRDLFVPVRSISEAIRDVERASGFGRVIVYCHHGVRSMSVANWLASRGHSGLENLRGGIDAWSVQVDPSVPRY